MRWIWRLLVQLVLIAALAFLFIVLYAHGTTDFWSHAREEWGQLLDWFRTGAGNSAPSR